MSASTNMAQEAMELHKIATIGPRLRRRGCTTPMFQFAFEANTVGVAYERAIKFANDNPTLDVYLDGELVRVGAHR